MNVDINYDKDIDSYINNHIDDAIEAAMIKAATHVKECISGMDIPHDMVISIRIEGNGIRK